jgi:hypothetical protein
MGFASEKVTAHVYACNYAAAKDVIRRESLKKGKLVSDSAINSWLELKFGRLQVDYDLMNSLEIFRAELETAEADESDM